MSKYTCLLAFLFLWKTQAVVHADDLLSAPGHSKPATDFSAGGVSMENRDALRKPTITVECWARLHDAAKHNILVASDAKASSQHWELYTMKDSGCLAFYVPSMRTNIPASTTKVCDDTWHYLAVIYDVEHARLYVDGVMVEDVPLPPQQGDKLDGAIVVGGLVEGPLATVGCNGLIQDVRISKGPHDISMPTTPFTKEASTLALWPLDKS